MNFTPHSKKQADVLFSEKRITIAGTGIQWGKSLVGVIRLKIDMHRYTDPLDNFLVTSPSYKILYQSTLPPFLVWNDGIGHYNKKDEVFEIYGGGKVWFRTNANPDSVVGITNVRHVLCDEAGLYGRYFWDNVQARSSFKQCPITIVTSPYSLNWLYTDFIRPHMNGDENIRNLIHLCQARSDENPYFPRDEFELRRLTMDPRRFNMIYGGAFDKAEGLVYDCFDQKKHVIDRKKLPLGTRYFAGIDWGYTDPTVIVVHAVTENGCHYQVEESYKTQQRLSDSIDEAHRLSQLYGIEKFYADPSRPDAIAEFNKYGLRCIPAQNEILKGIERHYELIKSDEYFVFKDANRYTIDEYETYHFQDPKDLKPNQNLGDKMILPVDQCNHSMDANRYCTMGTWLVGKHRNAVHKSDEKSAIPARVSTNTDLELKKILKKLSKKKEIL